MMILSQLEYQSAVDLTSINELENAELAEQAGTRKLFSDPRTTADWDRSNMIENSGLPTVARLTHLPQKETHLNSLF